MSNARNERISQGLLLTRELSMKSHIRGRTGAPERNSLADCCRGCGVTPDDLARAVILFVCVVLGFVVIVASAFAGDAGVRQ